MHGKVAENASHRTIDHGHEPEPGGMETGNSTQTEADGLSIVRQTLVHNHPRHTGMPKKLSRR